MDNDIETYAIVVNLRLVETDEAGLLTNRVFGHRG